MNQQTWKCRECGTDNPSYVETCQHGTPVDGQCPGKEWEPVETIRSEYIGPMQGSYQRLIESVHQLLEEIDKQYFRLTGNQKPSEIETAREIDTGSVVHLIASSSLELRERVDSTIERLKRL